MARFSLSTSRSYDLFFFHDIFPMTLFPTILLEDYKSNDLNVAREAKMKCMRTCFPLNEKRSCSDKSWHPPWKKKRKADKEKQKMRRFRIIWRETQRKCVSARNRLKINEQRPSPLERQQPKLESQQLDMSACLQSL